MAAIVDYNKLQAYGPTSEVLELSPLADKWRAFGFDAIEVDGHDVAALQDVLNAPAGDRPRAVICLTVKGKGIPIAENNATWHHKSKLRPEELTAIIDALGEA